MRHLLIAAVCALAACAPAPETTPTPATPVSTTERPVIATLQTQQKKVSILGGTTDGELRVVVRSNDGTVLADGITVDELSRTDPLLGVLVRSAVANNDGTNGGTYLDASLSMPRRR